MKNPIRKWTDKLDGKWETILISLCELVAGVLLLIKPLKFTAGIIIAAGVIGILMGLKYGIKYFRMDIIRASAQRDFFKALVLVGGGVFLIFGSGWLSATQEVLNIVYGVSLLILSAEKIQWSINLLRWQKPYWYVTGINAVLTVVMSIFMLLNPFPDQIIWIVMGIALVAEAILDMVALFFSGKKTKVHTVAVNVNQSEAPKEKRDKKKQVEEKIEKQPVVEDENEQRLDELSQKDASLTAELHEEMAAEPENEPYQGELQTEEK